MERTEGVRLDSIWNSIRESVKPKLIKEIANYLKNLKEMKSGEKVTCHDDLGFYNIMTNGTGITRFLDWEISKFEDPF